MEVIHPVVVSYGNENAAGPDLNRFIRDVGTHVEVELLKAILGLLAASHVFRNSEDRKQYQRERHA